MTEELKIEKLGLFSKALLFLSAISYFGTFCNKYFTLVFANIPLFTVYYLEVFRLITSWITNETFFELSFSLLLIFSIINYWENKEGTFKFFVKFSINAIVFQVFVLFIYYFLHFLFSSLWIYQIKVLHSISIAFLVKHLLLTNTKSLVVLNDKKINDRLMIIVYIFLFLLINGFRYPEFLLSFYYGFLMCKFPKYLNSQIIQDQDISRFERNEQYRYLTNIYGWISFDQAFSKKATQIPEAKVNVHFEESSPLAA